MRRVLVLLLVAIAAAHRATAQSAPEGFAMATPLGIADGPRPVIAFQPSDPGFHLATVRLDSLDVTALLERDGEISHFTPIADLAGGEHVVAVAWTSGGASKSVEWRFTTPLPPPNPQEAAGWSLQGEAARSVQEGTDPGTPRAYTTPLSGTPHVEGSIARPDGSRSATFNASLAQQYEHANPPTHVSAPAVILGAKAGRVSATLGNGPVETFAPALLLSTMTTRRGLEVGVDTTAGAFRAFGNIDDGLPSAAGVNQFRQDLYGLSFAPALGERVRVHATYQYAADERDPLYDGFPQLVPPPGTEGALPGTSELQQPGAPQPPPPQPPFPGSTPRKAQLLDVAAEWSAVPSVNLVLRAEAARSAFSADSRTTPVDADWAYGASASANPAGFMLQVGARVFRDGFGSPASPAVIAGRKVWDASVSKSLGAISLSATYARTSDSGRSLVPEGKADTGGLNAAYQVAKTGTSLSVGLQANAADAGGMTSKGTNLSLNVMQPVGGLQLSLGLLGGRQESGGPLEAENRTSGATVGVARMGEVFSIQANAGWNRSRNVLTSDAMTSFNAFVQPDVTLLAKRLSLTPIGVYARMRTTGGLGESDSYSWGGRLTLRTWGALRGFAVFGQYLESAIEPKGEGALRMHDRKVTAGLVVLLGGGSLGPTVSTQIAFPQTPLR